MRFARIIKVIPISLLAFLPVSCLKEKFGEKCEATYYATSIKPFFIANCANSSNCHASNGAASIDLTKYNVIFKSKDEIIRRLSLDPTDDAFMPKGLAPVSSGELQMLNDWIAKGADGCD